MAEGRIKDARNRSSRYGFMESSRRKAEMELKRLKEREELKEKTEKGFPKAGYALKKAMKASKFPTKK